MEFPGFSLPDGAWFPPELIHILPDIGTMSELKVTIAAIYETLRVGVVEAIISLGDFEAITGLDRKSVSRGIQAAIDRGTFKRQKVGNTWLYRLNIQQTLPAATTSGSRGKMPLAANGDRDENPSARGTMPLAGRGKMPQDGGIMPQNGGEMPQNRGTMPPHVVCCNTLSTTDDDKQQDKQHVALLAEMRQFGVRLAVAQKFVKQYDLEYLRIKLSQAMYAVEAGIATENGAGWFVTSVKENWQAPLGYYDDLKPKVGSRENRMRYIMGKYAEYIKH